VSPPAQPQSAELGFSPFACPTPYQFRAEVAWPGDWYEAQAGEAPTEAPSDAEEARMDEEMTDFLFYLLPIILFL